MVVSLAKTVLQEKQDHFCLEFSGSTKLPTTFDSTPSGEVKVGAEASEYRLDCSMTVELLPVLPVLIRLLSFRSLLTEEASPIPRPVFVASVLSF